MEIDFLGLSAPSYKLEKENRKNLYTDAGGGVEISLSLSTSSPLNLSEKRKKKWEFAGYDKMISPSCSGSGGGSTLCSLLSPYSLQENSYATEQPTQLLPAPAPPLFRRPTAAAGFLYNLNEAAATPNLSLRNMNMNMKMPQVSSQNSVYVSGINASTAGYTPTVAMARRATLARFLEKRLHRMNQARTSHLSATASEACETNNINARNNKKRTNNLKKR